MTVCDKRLSLTNGAAWGVDIRYKDLRFPTLVHINQIDVFNVKRNSLGQQSLQFPLNEPAISIVVLD